MSFKKVLWTFKRHPFLYRSRFKLLSKNSDSNEIASYTYNKCNVKKNIPHYFYEINDQIFLDGKPDSDLELVKVLSTWLVTHIKGGPGLSVASEEALTMMLSGQGGVCSDMAQIFNNFCVLNDIQVREWGSTRAPYEVDYGGHSYNEVYCKELEQWVLIDVSYGILFYEHETPLSVLDLYQLFRSGKKIRYSSFLNSDSNHDAAVQRNFLNPNTVPFLIANYRNTTYDQFLKNGRPYVPVFMIHFLIYMIGKSYHYKFPLDDYKSIFF